MYLLYPSYLRSLKQITSSERVSENKGNSFTHKNTVRKERETEEFVVVWVDTWYQTGYEGQICHKQCYKKMWKGMQWYVWRSILFDAETAFLGISRPTPSRYMLLLGTYFHLFLLLLCENYRDDTSESYFNVPWCSAYDTCLLYRMW